MKFVLLINLKLLTINCKFFLAYGNIAEHEDFFANKYENANYYWHFHTYQEKISCSAELIMKKSFITSGQGLRITLDTSVLCDPVI